uniref:Uncharacterized protein n=1 Tax=Triticum urartu TaxID=4572 RepID=A0A8R7PY01_TRIUA
FRHPSQGAVDETTHDDQAQDEQVIHFRRHRERQHVLPQHHPRRRLLPRHLRHDRAIHAADSVLGLARAGAPVHPVARPCATVHRHDGPALLSTTHAEPRRRLLLLAAVVGAAADLPPPERPEALASDPNECVPLTVHEEGLVAAPAAVVVDAEGDGAVGAVHRAAVAVEHQRLHPHRVRLPA